MKIYTVALPEEFAELARTIEKISIENHQSVSWTIRDMLCKSVNFTPVLDREIKKRDMFKNKTKNA